MELKYNEHVVEDLLRLRKEIGQKAFDRDNRIVDTTLAEVYYKMNSVIYKGYPRRM